MGISTQKKGPLKLPGASSVLFNSAHRVSKLAVRPGLNSMTLKVKCTSASPGACAAAQPSYPLLRGGKFFQGLFLILVPALSEVSNPRNKQTNKKNSHNKAQFVNVFISLCELT